MQFINYILGGSSSPLNQFFDVVEGVATIPSGSSSVIVSFASKDMSKTFYTHTWNADINVGEPDQMMVMGEMISATQIQFSTASNVSGNVSIQYYVFEGTPINPISVQHGKVSWTGQTSQAPFISAVTIANTFVLSSDSMGGNTFGSDDPTRAQIVTTTQLELRKSAAKVGGNTSYQVIENSRWTVSETDFQLTSGNNSVVVGLSGGHTFPVADSFMVGSGNVSTTPIPGNQFPRVSFNSTTQVRADSSANQFNTWDITIYAIDTAGDIYIEPVSFDILAGNSSAISGALTSSIPANRGALISSHLLASCPDHNNASILGEHICDKMDFSSTSTVRSTRSNGVGAFSQTQNIYACKLN